MKAQTALLVSLVSHVCPHDSTVTGITIRYSLLCAVEPHLQLHLSPPLGALLNVLAVLVKLLPLLEAVEEREVVARTRPKLPFARSRVTGEG